MRKRAAKKLAKTAKACRNFINAKPGRGKKDDFPGGQWVYRFEYLALYLCFPSNGSGLLGQRFEDFAKRFGPILNEFEKQKVNFALEVHPTEIAFDIASAQRAIEAVKVTNGLV